MLDPFVQLVSDEREKKFNGRTGESIAEIVGHSIDTASPREPMGLWLGKLLIRMGEKLAGQDSALKDTKEEL
ncbi:MAG: hypothetical protein ACM3MF_03100 [Anaerolineae bacterium]